MIKNIVRVRPRAHGAYVNINTHVSASVHCTSGPLTNVRHDTPRPEVQVRGPQHDELFVQHESVLLAREYRILFFKYLKTKESMMQQTT